MGTYDVGPVSARAGEGASVLVAAGAERVAEAGEAVDGGGVGAVGVRRNVAAGVLGEGQGAGEGGSEDEQRGDGEGLHCLAVLRLGGEIRYDMKQVESALMGWVSMISWIEST